MAHISVRQPLWGLTALVLVSALPAAAATSVPVSTAPVDDTERAHIVVAGSTLIAPFTEAIMTRLQTNAALPAANIRLTGTGKGIAEFCEGVGTATPDVVAVSRRMRHAEFETCVRNGVKDILEIQLGYEALVLVSRVDDDLSLMLDELYAALAGELPHGDEYNLNANKTWKDVDSRLPATPIAAILPSRDLGARGFFNDRFLQAACRDIFQINTIFEADDRVEQCIGLRRDGRITEVGLPFVENMRAAFEAAGLGTIGVMSLRHAQELSDIVKIISFDGVVATREAIADRHYRYVRPLNYYVKRAHVKDRDGNGPVAGLREFITEVTRDTTIGPDGYLVPLGLVPMAPDRRETVREAALHLHSFTR